MQNRTPESSLPLGAFYITLSMLGAAILGGLVKWSSAGFSSEFLTSVRFFSGFLVFLLIFAFSKRTSLKSDSPWTQFGVSASWVLGILIYYVSIRFIPLMDATLLLNTAAIFAPILARVFDGKREPIGVWIGTAIGFAGVVVVLRPGASLIENPMSAIGILAGFFAALRLLLNSKVKHEPAQRTTFYSLLFGCMVCLAILLTAGIPIRVPDWETMLFTPRESTPKFVDSSLIIVALAFGVISMLLPLLTSAGLRHASVGQVAPFRYTAVIFAAILDLVFWGEVPTWPSYVGFGLVLGGAIIILRGRKTTSPPTAKA